MRCGGKIWRDKLGVGGKLGVGEGWVGGGHFFLLP